MSKVKICYIGPKQFKKDTVAGSRQVFPRDTPIEVTEEVAAVLLRFSQVYIEADKLGDVEKARAAEKQAANEEAERLQAEAQEAVREMDHSVSVGGAEYDLLKMTVSKIQTLLEGNDIDIESKGAQEAAQDYKKRVRDALRELQE